MSACLYCRSSLGSNDIFPELPGRTLAFDSTDARLWVVCSSCARWNLAPLDDAERRALAAQLEQRYAMTPHAERNGIGVAQLGGGTSVIRVGSATWSQFAAWRYGKRLEKRRRNWWLSALTSVSVLMLLWSPVGDAILETSIGFWAIMAILCYFMWRAARQTYFRVPSAKGAAAKVTMHQAVKAKIDIQQQGWRLLMPSSEGVSVLEGRDAVGALSRTLTLLNHRGATQDTIAEAVRLIEDSGGPQRTIERVLSANGLGVGSHPLNLIPRKLILALEIAAAEEMEREALAGEVAALSLEWKEASTTAKIAESLW